MAFNGKLGTLALAVKVDTAQLNKQLSQVQGRMQQFGAKMRRVGAGLTAGVSVPFALMAKSAIQVAAAAEEMESKLAVVFGKSSDSVRKWADETAKAVGRSSVKLREAATDTQGLLRSAGLAEEAATGMSKSMVQLAIDTASFNNVTDAAAINAFQKALLGENEALKGVGLSLSAAEVKAEALNMGFKGSVMEMDAATKAAATYQALLKKTAQAQGDAERTVGSTANQMKAMAAAAFELQVVIGTQLIPAITPLVSVLTTVLTAFTSLPAPVQTTIIGITALTAVLGPLLIVIGSLVTTFIALEVALLPIALGVAAVSAALAASYAVWQNWDTIVSIVKETVLGIKQWLGDTLTAVLDKVKAGVQSVTDAFYNMYNAVVGNSFVPDMVEGVQSEFAKLDSVMVQPAQAANKAVSESFAATAASVQASVAKANSAAGGLGKGIGGGSFGSFGGGGSGSIVNRRSSLDSTFGLSEIGSIFKEVMSGNIEGIGDKFKGVFSGLLNKLIDGLFSKIGGASGGGGGGGLGGIGKIFGGLFGGGGGGGGGLGGLFGGFFADGGVPPVGRVSVVGENGPELFVPHTSGTVVPNGAGGGGNGVTIIHNNNFQGVNSVNRQELRAALDNNRQRTLSDVENMATRGGTFSRSLRG